MGRKSSIDQATGERLLEARQRLGSVRKAAIEVGVSRQAAQRHFDELGEAGATAVVAEVQDKTKPVPAAKRSRKAAATKQVQQQTITNAGLALLITAHDQLIKNVGRIEALIAQMDLEFVGANKKAWKDFDPKTLTVYLKAIEASTAHVVKAEDSYRLLIDAKETQRVLKVIIDVIAQIDPQARNEIIAQLEAERASGLLAEQAS